MKKLSVVFATKNEEKQIKDTLESVKNIADEIVLVDEYSTDKTREIARKYGAKIYKNRHKKNFHESKQMAIEKAGGEWILQLDADERVTPELAKEIKKVTNMSNDQNMNRKINSKKMKLFERHQRAVERRDGPIGRKTGEIVAFFIPRLNIF